MMSDIDESTVNMSWLKWQNHHLEVIERFVAELELPIQMSKLIHALWNEVRLQAARVPKSLIVDCVYVIAHMTGNRRSIEDLKTAADIVIGRRTKPFNQDRRKTKEIWINTDWAKEAILSLIPDEQSFKDFMAR